MSTNTVRLHRVLRATPERVYRAFLDADAMAKWLPPNGFTGKVHHLDARVGGTYKMSFTNFTTGQSHSFGGEVPRTGARTNASATPTRSTTRICRARCRSRSPSRRSLSATELNIVQEGIPDVIPAEACYLGWQESLTAARETGRGGDPGRGLSR